MYWRSRRCIRTLKRDSRAAAWSFGTSVLPRMGCSSIIQSSCAS